MKKVVLYISYNGLLDPVGQSQVLPYLRGLCSEYKFELLTFEREVASKEFLKIQTLRDELSSLGINWHILRTRSRTGLFKKFVDFCSGLALASKISNRTKIDILHARSYVAAMIGCILLKFKRIEKTIFDMRGFMADEYADIGYWSRRSLKYYLVKFFEKQFIKTYDFIVVLTTDAENILHTWGRSQNIKVIPCCVDTKVFQPLSNEERKKIEEELGFSNKEIYIYSGSLAGWYLLEDMLKYFMMIKKRNNNAFLLIVTQDETKELVSLLKKYSIVDYEITSAQITEMSRFIGIAQLGLLFIKQSESKKGSFPISMAEYLSCGVPVVTVPFNQYVKKMIADSNVGLICGTRDSEEDEYREYLKLIHTPDLRNRCRDVAIEKMSLSKVGIPAYRNLYENLAC